MKYLLIAFAIVLAVGLSAVISAATENGMRVELRDDNTWQWEAVADSLALIASPTRATDAVRVWKTELEHHPGEYSFQKEVRLYVHYHNLTTRPITGIKAYLTIKNSFNETVIKQSLQEEVLLAPGEKQESNTYWIFGDDSYLGKSPYQKLWRLADNGTAKIEVEVYGFAFLDGEIIEDAPADTMFIPSIEWR
jgi:hypothetical protein